MTAASLGCATSRTEKQPHPKLEELWREYEPMPEHKAIAVAGSLRGTRRSVVAAVAGQADAAAAREAALAECDKKRIRSGVQPQCVIYADGMKIVWRGY